MRVCIYRVYIYRVYTVYYIIRVYNVCHKGIYQHTTYNIIPAVYIPHIYHMYNML